MKEKVERSHDLVSGRKYFSCQLHAKYHIDLFDLNSNLIRKPTVVAHKGSLEAALSVSPSARVDTVTKKLHTVLLPIKIVGLISKPVSKLCLSFTVEAAVTQGPSPAVYQVIIETYPSLACSKRCS